MKYSLLLPVMGGGDAGRGGQSQGRGEIGIFFLFPIDAPDLIHQPILKLSPRWAVLAIPLVDKCTDKKKINAPSYCLNEFFLELGNKLCKDKDLHLQSC